MRKIVQGKPIHVGDRELVPIVRVEKETRRRALVGAKGVAGEGASSVHMRPVAVLERRGGTGERRLSIPDRTAQLVNGLLLAAFVIPLLVMVAVEVSRRSAAPKK